MEKTLPEATHGRISLFGWQKLVYDRLPDKTFTTSYMYKNEKEFKEIYTENKHIRGKIRQILQQLRDMGLVNLWILINGQK